MPLRPPITGYEEMDVTTEMVNAGMAELLACSKDYPLDRTVRRIFLAMMKSAPNPSSVWRGQEPTAGQGLKGIVTS